MCGSIRICCWLLVATVDDARATADLVSPPGLRHALKEVSRRGRFRHHPASEPIWSTFGWNTGVKVSGSCARAAHMSGSVEPSARSLEMLHDYAV